MKVNLLTMYKLSLIIGVKKTIRNDKMKVNLLTMYKLSLIWGVNLMTMYKLSLIWELRRWMFIYENIPDLSYATTY
jgi:hypothetical protein